MSRLALGALGLLLIVPLLIDAPYYTDTASQILIAAVFAASLNLLVGYGGLVSLGHAAYLGTAAYLTAYLTVTVGLGALAAIALALLATSVMAALFGLLALRSTGIGFLMITLALAQTLWGVAYRWVGVTGGDNGILGVTRPAPFGLDLSTPKSFYVCVLVGFLVAMAAITAFVRSGLGASLMGSRDQPRRMRMLGHNVWLVQWLSFVLAGFWAAVAGVGFVYYNQFVSPHVLALTNCAEVLLMVIAGGAGTLLGPLVGAALVVILKNVVSAYVVRWMMLLGVVFLAIVVFMPEGLAPGARALLGRLKLRPPARE
jgi:branched-chain amino acid transport system permease protein